MPWLDESPSGSGLIVFPRPDYANSSFQIFRPGQFLCDNTACDNTAKSLDYVTP